MPPFVGLSPLLLKLLQEKPMPLRGILLLEPAADVLDIPDWLVISLTLLGDSLSFLVDTAGLAAATCGAVVLGFCCCIRVLNRDFSLLGLRPVLTPSSAGWVICAISIRVSSSSSRLVLDWR